MSINFATLQGLAIPEGVVTQIMDAAGRVLWMVGGGGEVILEVEKVTSNTYAAETTYENEEFILLNIYPKTNGTVNVTYGGLTKTIVDTSGVAEPNAIPVFFGTFNGVSDSVATPASGTLTIEGDYAAFAVGNFSKTNKSVSSIDCGCITAVKSFGGVQFIPDRSFAHSVSGFSVGNYLLLEPITIPTSVASIGVQALYYTGVPSITMLATAPPILKYRVNTVDGVDTNVYDNFPSNTQFIVPKGSGETYKAAEGWSEYADKITEAS